mmetsp:Transcript_23946/g.46946  ORF Transcript_23946/g.46946 Transcript_23946/m.46946 type:complete len:180 (+) Transcript_23946:712-1251(+)
MGWLRLGRRTDAISPLTPTRTRRQPHSEAQSNGQDPDTSIIHREEEISEEEGISTHTRAVLSRQEIGLGRLVPPMGRQAPVLYGNSDWHKFRWANDDYDCSKLAVAIVVEDPNLSSGGLDDPTRSVRIRTAMWMEHTSYLSYILLVPTWWLVTWPLCGVIHRGIVRNIQQEFPVGSGTH